MIQSPLWSSAILMLEQLTVGLLVQLKKAMGEGETSAGAGTGAGDTTTNIAPATTGKRDVPQINHIIDILSVIAERTRQLTLSIPIPLTLSTSSDQSISTSVLDNDPNQSTNHIEIVMNDINELIKRKLNTKWKLETPLWQKVAQDVNNTMNTTLSSLRGSYWNTTVTSDGGDVSVSTTTTTTATGAKGGRAGRKGSKGKGKKDDDVSVDTATLAATTGVGSHTAMHFMKALDALVEINSDIIDILHECLISHDNTVIQALLIQGAVSITMQILPTLHDTFSMDR